MNYFKKNIIDGLPASYDHNYVIKAMKECQLCRKKINTEDLELNNILCTENFEFIHKPCLEKFDLEPVYSKPNDNTSMIKVRKKAKVY